MHDTLAVARIEFCVVFLNIAGICYEPINISFRVDGVSRVCCALAQKSKRASGRGRASTYSSFRIDDVLNLFTLFSVRENLLMHISHSGRLFCARLSCFGDFSKPQLHKILAINPLQNCLLFIIAGIRTHEKLWHRGTGKYNI